MNTIKCELCGSNKLIKTDGVYQCEFCGTKYTTEEAKKLMIYGTVEFVKGSAEKERLLRNADDFINLGDFDKAYKIYQEIADQYPGDYIGWAKLAEFPFIKATKTNEEPLINSLLESIKFGRKAKKINDEFTLASDWEKLIQKHEKLKINNSMFLNKAITNLDRFDADLICLDTSKLNSYLAKIQKTLTDEYCKRLLDGELGLFQTNTNSFYGMNIWGDDSIEHSYIDNNLPYKNEPMNNLFKQGKRLAEKLNKCFSYSKKSRRVFIKEVFESDENYPDDIGIMFVIGKNVVYICHEHISIKRLNYTITDQTIETVLQKINIHSYTPEDIAKAEVFVGNFLKNVADKDRIIGSLSRELGKGPGPGKETVIVSIDGVSFQSDIRIEYTYKFAYEQNRNYPLKQSLYLWGYGTMDVFEYLQNYNKANRCGLCPNCGCQYKGLFKRICSGCGQ